MNVAFIDTVHPVLNEMLESKGITCTPFYNTDRESLKEVIGEYHGIVIRSRIKMDADFLAYASSLQFIARSGAGMENIDLDYCAQHNITCFNSPEGNRDAVGEQAMGMLLMLLNNLKRADAEVRNGVWLREENRGYEIAGKTVGIIGYGNMGSALAQKLSGFDCNVIAYDKYKLHYSNKSIMENIYSSADIVSLHVPLTTETQHLVNAEFIARMQKPFYLLNTARGQNVDTAALVHGLETGKIRGACLDVLEYEKSSFENLDLAALPAPMQYLVQSEKVILSPHIAGWTHESHYKLSWFLGEKIIAHFGL